MPEAETTSVPVLIVGAGPAGLITAITLAHQGVGSLLVERRDDVSDHPRATVISTRSMELLRSWGLESRIQAGAVDVTPAAWVTHTLASAQGSVLPVGLPDRAQAAAVSPTGPAWAPQDHLESVLISHLRTHRDTQVRYRTELTKLDQDHGGVRATLRDHNGTVTTVEARFVVAADGAHSMIRDILGIPMLGPDRVRESLLALFTAPLWDVVGDRRYGIYLTGHAETQGLFGLPATGQAKAEGVFIAAGGDRWMYGRDWEPGRERVTDYPADRLIRLVQLGAGVPTLTPRLLRVGGFTFAAQLAERFRDRRVFLVGDAAHRVTPIGGLGMNTAIHGGYDLGWKLAWTLKGWAGPELLDTYETQRRPIAEANLIRSAQGDGGFERTAAQGLAIDLHDRLPHTWLPTTDSPRSTLDLLGLGLTLLTGHSGPDWQAAVDAVDTPVPLVSHALDAATAAAIGIEPGTALLVRPDAHITACRTGDQTDRTDQTDQTDQTDPLAALRTGIRHATGSTPGCATDPSRRCSRCPRRSMIRSPPTPRSV